MSDETKQKLPPFITIEVDGKPFEVFMSFALLNRVCYLMGDSTQIPLILQDAELREAVLTEALAERDAKGKVLNKRGVDDVAVSLEDIQNVLEFISEHVADFTVGTVERANSVMQARLGRINALQKASSSTATQTGPAA